MKILEYNEFIETNDKLAESILIKLIDVSINEQLFEKTVDFSTKMGNFFSTLEQGSKTGKNIADYLKNINSKGIGATARDIKDSIQSFFRGGKGIFTSNEFERIADLFAEILQKSNSEFKLNLKPQLEEIDELIRKYADTNNIKYISKNDFKNYFKEDRTTASRQGKNFDRDSVSN